VCRSNGVYQSSYKSLCKLLRGVLAEGVQAGFGAEEGIASLRCRTSGALYHLLLTHPMDPQGRCCCCARPGGLFPRRRQHCWVHLVVAYWLRQPEWALYFEVEGWGLGAQSPPRPPGGADHASGPAGRQDTAVLPRIAEPSAPVGTQPGQTPAGPPSPPPMPRGAGRPEPTDGGAGGDPQGSRHRRVPSPGSPSLLLSVTAAHGRDDRTAQTVLDLRLPYGGDQVSSAPDPVPSRGL